MDNDNLIVIAVAVVVLLVLAAWAFSRKRRRDALVGKFGPEYDRAVKQFGGHAKADAELTAREQRFAKAHLRPLTPADRERFLGLWQLAQSRFVDSPAAAIDEADRLIDDVMRLRGYPVGDSTQRMADVAIGHPHLLDHYRGASEVSRRSRDGKIGTEDLRQAMVHYRALFEDLLETAPVESAGRRA